MNFRYQNLVDLSAALGLFVVIGTFLFLFESRWPKRKYLFSLILFMILWCGGNLAILLKFGIVTLGKYIIFTATLPSLLYFFIAAKNRDGRFFFTFCLVDTVMLWLMAVSALIDYALGAEGLVIFVLRMAGYPAMLFISWRFARKPYLSLLGTAHRGWWLFSAMTGFFYIILVYISCIPTNLRLRPEDMPLAVMILILLPLTYMTIFIVLYQQNELFYVQERQHMFEAQASMMERRISELRDADNRFRIERHNLRHHVLLIASMLQKNDVKAALDYIGASRRALETTVVERYCANPALDAIVSSYFRQAEEQGIQIEAQIELPSELPVPPAELSIVWANALENAIRAVAGLAEERRRIIFKCKARPRFMMEISNPCEGGIPFDRKGFPVTDKPGHGIGVKSIAAFAEKYNALCLFRAEDGWFRLQIVM